MEKLPTVKLEKRSQKTTKKNPVKVVYISNPMKINATPSEFRAVVQQLTGRYATYPPPVGALARVPVKDHDHKQEVGFSGGRHQQKWQLNRTSIDARLSTGSDLSHESACREDQVMDDLITPQMLAESFPPLFPL